MKKLLVIGAGPSQLAGILKGREMGLAVLAADADAHAPGLKLAHQSFVMDIKDPAAMIELAKKEIISGVVSFSIEVAVRTVAAVAQELRLPGMSPEAAVNATDKSRMRSLWKKNHVPSPESIVCDNLRDAINAASEVGYPCVVKPPDSAGSRGVSRVDSALKLEDAFACALSYSERKCVLVESYMEGEEISVEGFVFQGKFYLLTLSDKIRTNPPYLLDTTVLFPSKRSKGLQNKATQIVSAAAESMGLDMCPIHAEVMITPNGPMMVELAARGPGFKVFSDVIPWVTGVDVVKESIRVAIGEKPDFCAQKIRGAVLRFPESRPGIVDSVLGVEQAKLLKGIADLEIYVKPGDLVKPLTGGPDRIGHIISLCENRMEAESAVHQAESLIQINLKKEKVAVQ